MLDPEKKHRPDDNEEDGTWTEWTRREDGKDQIMSGSTRNNEEGRHSHVVFNDDEDRTLDYFRLENESHDNPSFDTSRGDVYPSEDSK